MATSMRLGGLITGVDTDALIKKIMDFKRIPITHIQQEEDILDVKISSVNSIKSSISNLQSSLSNLTDTAWYDESDKDTVKSALSDFVTQFNSLQNVISSYTKTPTSYKDFYKTESILRNESNIIELDHDMRLSVGQKVGEGSVQMLEDLGIQFNEYNNTLSFNSVKFNTVYTGHPDEVKTVVSTLMTNLNDLINNKIGVDLTNNISNFNSQKTKIGLVVQDMEEQMTVEEDRLVKSFTAMEQYQSSMQTILGFLKSVNK